MRECLSQLTIKTTKDSEFVRNLTALSLGINKLKTTLVPAVEKSLDTGVTAIIKTVAKLVQAKPATFSPTVNESQHTLQKRIDGIDEYTGNNINGQLESKKCAAANICKHLELTPTLTDISRLGNFDKDKFRPSTMLVKFHNSWDVRKIFSKRSQLKTLTKKVYLPHSMKASYQKMVKACWLKRRELENTGVNPSRLKFGHWNCC